MAIATFDKSKPGDINFGIGQPAPDLMPVDLFGDFATSFFSNAMPEDFNYGAVDGDPRFLSALSKFLSTSYNTSVSPQSLFLTAGNSHGIDLVCERFTKPEDTILVEEASYFLAFPIFRDRQLNVISVPTDSDGVIIDRLEEAVKKYHPRAVYVIPDFNNPTGVSLSTCRRVDLTNLSKLHDFILISDDAYQMLSYTETSSQAMGTLVDAGNVVSLGTFSKILAPGFRVGWIQSSHILIEKIRETGWLNSGGSVSHFGSQIVRYGLESGKQEKHLQYLLRCYRSRVTAMHDALLHYLGNELTWEKPLGGYFFWLALNSKKDVKPMREESLRRRTGFQPGSLFSCDAHLNHYMRLSFSHYTEDQIWEGISRLAPIIKSN